MLNAVWAEEKKTIALEANMAEVITFGKHVSEIFIANPDIADVQLNNANTAYIFGKKPGSTTVFISDKAGKVLQKLNVTVSHSLSQLNQMLKTVGPQEKVQAISSPSGIILKGSVSTPKVAKDFLDVARQFSTQGESIINNMTVEAPTQVYLKVKVAEVSRDTLNKININWSSAIRGQKFLFGILQGGTVIDTTTGTFAVDRSTENLSGLGLRFNDGTSSAETLINLLNREGLATILAEPNLTAKSGETASFLAGGEFPFPVPQDQNITIEFKKFGISLAFTPTVLSSKQINLRVNPEVSELDFSNQLQIPVAGAVVTVPGISTRRVETSVELASGQSLAIAGLFSNSINDSVREYPGLADLPVIGPLFRSTSYERSEKELVVIVTPYIVEPLSGDELVSPTDKVYYPTQIEMVLDGKINKPTREGIEKLADTSVEYTTNDHHNENHLIGAAGFYHE
jgi:pilus assembly protein CpaC